MSHEHDSPETDLNAIEAALGSLAPSKSRLNRDRLMFEAGRASARQSGGGRRRWIVAAASLALVASVEGALLARRPSPGVVERIVVVREPAKIENQPAPEMIVKPEPGSPMPGLISGYGLRPNDRLASQLLRYGLDGLPAPGRPVRGDSASSPVVTRTMLQDELRKDLEMGDPS